MKNKITMKRKLMFVALLMFALAIGAAAQAITLGLGDTVITPDGRKGYIGEIKYEDTATVRFSEKPGDSKNYMLKDLKLFEPPKPPRTTPIETFRVGDFVIDLEKRRNLQPIQQLRIDSISGDSAVVRYGNGNYNIYTTKLENLLSLKTWERMQDDENRQKILRAEFADEAKPYMTTVKILANAYNPQFYDNGDSFTGNAANQEAWRKDLEALAAVCRKYPNITNGNSGALQSIEEFPADVCKLAEQRVSVIQKTKSKLGDMSADRDVRRWAMKLDEAANNSEGLIDDEVQMLLYNRAAWEQKYLKNLKKTIHRARRADAAGSLKAARRICRRDKREN